MRAIEASWPRQSRWTYLVRYSASLDCSQLQARDSIGSLIGFSHGRVVTSIVWSPLRCAASGPTCWGGYASAPAFPCSQSWSAGYEASTTHLAALTELAKTFSTRLPPAVDRPGRRAIGECDWVFPVLVDDPIRLRALAAARGVRQFVGHYEHRGRSPVRDCGAIPSPRGVSAAVSGDAGERTSIARRRGGAGVGVNKTVRTGDISDPSGAALRPLDPKHDVSRLLAALYVADGFDDLVEHVLPVDHGTVLPGVD